MESSKNPGISIENVVLVKSNVEMVDLSGTQKYNLSLTNLDRHEVSDGNKLNLFAAFDLMSGIDKPVFRFTCEFMVTYTRNENSSMQWKDFSNAVALAHVIPYLREYVSNITNRLPAPILILHPLNTHAMVANYEAHKREIGQATATASGSPQST